MSAEMELRGLGDVSARSFDKEAARGGGSARVDRMEVLGLHQSVQPVLHSGKVSKMSWFIPKSLRSIVTNKHRWFKPDGTDLSGSGNVERNNTLEKGRKK